MSDKQLSGALEQTACRIGMLAYKLSEHPLRRVWTWRARIDATIAASAMNGFAVQRERLLSRLAGLDIPLMKDAGAEQRAIGIYTILASIDDERYLRDLESDENEGCSTDFGQDVALVESPKFAGWRGAILSGAEVALESLRSKAGGPALLALAETAWEIRREHDTTASPLHYVVPVWLRERLDLHRSPPLFGLVPWPNRMEEPDWVLRFIEEIGAKASVAAASLDNLMLSWQIVSDRLGKRRSDSSADMILASAFLLPCISPAWVSEQHGISLTAAGRQLQDMTDKRILVETADRSTHKIYALADMPIVEVRRGIEKPRPEARMLDQVKWRDEESDLAARLDVLMDGVDAAIRRSTLVLLRCGVKLPEAMLRLAKSDDAGDVAA